MNNSVEFKLFTRPARATSEGWVDKPMACVQFTRRDGRVLSYSSDDNHCMQFTGWNNSIPNTAKNIYSPEQFLRILQSFLATDTVKTTAEHEEVSTYNYHGDVGREENVKKYAVYFTGGFNPPSVESMIHIFAESAEEAERCVRNNGVGGNVRGAVYADKILRVAEVKQS